MRFEIVLSGMHTQEPATHDQVRREVATLVERLNNRGFKATEIGVRFDVRRREPEPPETGPAEPEGPREVETGGARTPPPDPQDMTVDELTDELHAAGVNPETLEGTGSGGNVVKSDLVAAVARSRAAGEETETGAETGAATEE